MGEDTNVKSLFPVASLITTYVRQNDADLNPRITSHLAREFDDFGLCVKPNYTLMLPMGLLRFYGVAIFSRRAFRTHKEREKKSDDVTVEAFYKVDGWI